MNLDFKYFKNTTETSLDQPLIFMTFDLLSTFILPSSIFA